MRRLAFVLPVLLSLWAAGQVGIHLVRGSPEEVIRFVEGSTLPSGVKEQWLSVLPDSFSENLLNPTVALAFFQGLEGTPIPFATELTAILVPLLQQGLPVDRLMNKVLQGMAMGRSWEAILEEVRLRAGLISAAQAVLAPYRPTAEAKASFRVKVGSLEFGGRSPTWGDLIVEFAWAMGDFIVGGGSPNELEGMRALVEGRLRQLRGAALLPQHVDRVLAALSPELLGQITARVFRTERR